MVLGQEEGQAKREEGGKEPVGSPWAVVVSTRPAPMPTNLPAIIFAGHGRWAGSMGAR